MEGLVLDNNLSARQGNLKSPLEENDHSIPSTKSLLKTLASVLPTYMYLPLRPVIMDGMVQKHCKLNSMYLETLQESHKSICRFIRSHMMIGHSGCYPHDTQLGRTRTTAQIACQALIANTKSPWNL
jgi:hypothetical protein